MKGYVFIGNSSKPSEEKNKSREPVKPSNVSIPCIEAALKLGYDVYLGTNRENPESLECTYPVKLYDSHTYRSIIALKDNIIAYKNLCKVIEEGNVEVIHCNTPVGGMIGRICGRKYNVKKIIYTAHGFHFYKGAPLINRTLFKWAEQLMARWTDVIITMNEEDFQAAQKFKLRKNGKVYKVHGVGITLSEFQGLEDKRELKRKELKVGADDIVLISAGDLVKRKNYDVAIKAVAKLNNPKLKYFICGKGPQLEHLKKLAISLEVENQVYFLGYRTDIKELMIASDIFLFTTLQEGLPRSMMEAMACGLPCVASNIRGNVDLIKNGVSGYLCDACDVDSFARAINQLVREQLLRQQISEYNLKQILKYDVDNVKKEINDIYYKNLLRNV